MVEVDTPVSGAIPCTWIVVLRVGMTSTYRLKGMAVMEAAQMALAANMKVLGDRHSAGHGDRNRGRRGQRGQRGPGTKYPFNQRLDALLSIP